MQRPCPSSALPLPVFLSVAPLFVPLRKSLFTDAADAFAMPEGRDKIYPFLVPIGAFRALKHLIHARKDLVCQGNEIVLQRNTRLHVEIILTADQFQLLSQSVHRSIFSQFCPEVKTKLCNLDGIFLVVLHLPHRTFGIIQNMTR